MYVVSLPECSEAWCWITIVITVLSLVSRSTCLSYELDPKEVGKKPDDVTADQAMDILKALVKSSREEVQMESPRLFGRWRAALEGMNNETIHEVFDRAYNCSAYSQTCRDNPDKEKIARYLVFLS